jgi:hypothetical protein
MPVLQRNPGRYRVFVSFPTMRSIRRDSRLGTEGKNGAEGRFILNVEEVRAGFPLAAMPRRE